MGKGGNPEALDLGAAFSRPKRQCGRPTQTAAAHWPPPHGPGAPWEEDKWLALGETRRAAAKCKTIGGREEVHPFSLANGPDGTKGFKVHRTTRGESSANAWEPGRLWDAFWNRPISPMAFALGNHKAVRPRSGLEVKPSGLMCVTRRSLADGRMTLTITVHCMARAVGTIVGMVKITRRS